MKYFLLISFTYIFLNVCRAQDTAKLNISSSIYSTQQNLFGINLTSFFKIAPTGSTTAGYTWKWISDLRPQVLRFPSGSNGKFAHPSIGPGYGYNLCEIAKYFDYLDDTDFDLGTCPSLTTVAEVESFKSTVDGIIANTAIEKQFDDYVTEYKAQIALPAGTRYIKQLGDLVDTIEAKNSGLDVKIIYCANVITATATELKNTLKYLIDTLGLNVVGVEMGNETYADVYDPLFCTFNNYYAFINNTSDINTAFLNGVAPSVIGNHDYVFAVKHNYPSLRVGVVAAPMDYKLFVTGDIGLSYLFGCDGLSTWNSQLKDKMLTKRPFWSGIQYYDFDAIIIHPYYNPAMWSNCIDSIFKPGTTNTCPIYSYTSADSRINYSYNCALDSFNYVFGSSDTSFQKLIVKYDSIFDFNTTPSFKKMWTTEWNLKDDFDTPLDADNNDDIQFTAFTNSLLQGYLDFEWLLKQYTLNTEVTSLSDNYHTISTVQNALGGSNSFLISNYNATKGDAAYPVSDYARRILYYDYLLLKNISAYSLYYVPSTVTYTGINKNINFHVFVNAGKNQMYIYYSNLNKDTVILQLNEANLETNLFGGFDKYFGGPFGTFIRGEQLYSTVGYNYIYTYNTCYNTSNMPLGINGFLNFIWEVQPFNIFIYPYSYGYMRISVTGATGHRLNNDIPFFDVYPDPANNILNITSNDKYFGDTKFQIFNSLGRLVLEKNVNLNEISNYALDISNLVTGIYILSINSKAGNKTEKIVISN